MLLKIFLDEEGNFCYIFLKVKEIFIQICKKYVKELFHISRAGVLIISTAMEGGGLIPIHLFPSANALTVRYITELILKGVFMKSIIYGDAPMSPFRVS